MKKINNVEFGKLIEGVDDEDIQILDYEIELINDISIDLSYKSYSFKNCIFKGARMDFYKFNEEEDESEFQSLNFVDCEIKSNLFIKECTLYSVEFSNVKITSDNFYICHSYIDSITITGSADMPNTIKSIVIDNLKSPETFLDIRLNEISDSITICNSSFGKTFINANFINRINIYESEFNNTFQFWKNILKSYSTIENNKFNDVEFMNSDFGSEVHFSKIKFSGNCNFESSKGTKTRVKFSKCNFDEYVYFDKSLIYEIVFDTAFFKEIVSFQNLKCNSIKFNRTHFDKVGFFNDVEIENLNKCDLKTIRFIKNQLLKAENKIDYLKYNALEQSSFLANSELSFNDRTLLKLNKKSNDFGNNWTMGVLFTLRNGVLFFILVLIANSFLISEYPLSINYRADFASFSQILAEFLKFVFSLGFDNKEIQSNGILYLLFIIAKIYIGYGVYQTISAFRKYGKN